MLIVNEQPLGQMQADSPQRKYYEEKKKEIAKLKGLLVVRAFREDSTAAIYYDDKKMRLQAVPRSLPCKWVVRSDRGTEVWRYADAAMPQGNNKFRYEPTAFLVTGQIELSPTDDIEKIFYVLYIMGDRGLGSCGLYVFDPVKVAQKKIATYAGDELDVRYQIFRNHGIPEESMRQIALAWNMTDAYNLHIDILKEQLFERVLAAHKRNPQDNQAFKRFLQDCKLGEVTEVKAIVNKAVAEGKIFNFDRNTRRWLYQNGDYICQVPPEKLEDKNNSLVEYYLKAERFEELQALRQEVWSDHIPPSYNLEQLDKMTTIEELRKVAKDLNKTLPFQFKDVVKARKWVVENCGIV